MKPGAALAAARRRAGLSQRALAERAGVPQSTVARIENSTIDPRVATLQRLLAACDHELDVFPRLGEGIDRSQIREELRKSPRARLIGATAAGVAMEELRAVARKRAR